MLLRSHIDAERIVRIKPPEAASISGVINSSTVTLGARPLIVTVTQAENLKQMGGEQVQYVCVWCVDRAVCSSGTDKEKTSCFTDAQQTAAVSDAEADRCNSWHFGKYSYLHVGVIYTESIICVLQERGPCRVEL